MTSSNLITWLKERTALSLLSRDILAKIAPLLAERSFPPNETIIRENEPADGLYILKVGHAESTISPKGSTNGDRSLGLLPGSVLNLQVLLLNQPTQETVVTQNECEFWFVDAASFQTLSSQHPEIAQCFARELAEEVAQLSSQLAAEQERQAILRPYLVTKARRGILGKSRYATRLRKEIKQASEERQSALIFGEPGLEKDNIAALIHYGSADRREAIIKVDCSKLQTSGAELFGRAGGKPGLLETVGSGTLILNNIQELPSELFPAIAKLLETGTYTPVARDGKSSEPIALLARIILISEKRFAQIEPLVGRIIKVPPLRVRKTDIGDWVSYYLSLVSRAKGLPKPRVSPEAIRRLQSYDFPNNLRELDNLVQRATVQLQGCREITEEVIWPSQGKKQRFRVNLLNVYPRLRQFLRSSWWPDRINYGFTLTAFALLVAILFLGPQTRDRNFALNLFWAWWWPLILLIFPFLGRVWCAVCPFMIYGEITQKLSLWLFPRQLKRWPREEAEKWGGWFLFGLFALILLWEELWDLPNTAYLSACLLLLITAGAMICSAIFERRFWCRYLCPIGGMNGMFAKLSMTELRAQQGICSAECTTYQCYKGGPRKGEGMETNGCPLYSHPAQLEDNRDCVLCMTCLKACPHRSVEFNVRPPGIELWTTHNARAYEVALLLLLLDVVFMHCLPEIQAMLGLNFDLTQFWQHAIFAVVVLSLPGIIPLIAQGVMRVASRVTHQFKPHSFINLAYGYLPLVLAGNLAYYLPLGLGEGGRILPVALATFGLGGEGLPVWVAHPAVIAFLQGTVLIVGTFLSAVVTQQIARQPLRWLLPQHLAIVCLGLSYGAILL
ncbi:MAG: cyclic nucleotide-binding domain-containing protein [Cyanobacteriota bacterium]|nr:cyclic nucleotide-binding domain-containing protein [Cyanobacteriota bacterium]